MRNARLEMMLTQYEGTVSRRYAAAKLRGFREAGARHLKEGFPYLRAYPSFDDFINGAKLMERGACRREPPSASATLQQRTRQKPDGSRQSP